MPILRVENLNKTYPNGVVALKNINFTVEKGEFLVIIGLSGSGKTTLLRCLNRLIEPTSGQVFFNGENATEFTGAKIRELRRDLAMIFQNFNLVERHSVLKNVLSGRLAVTPTWKSLLGIFTKEDHELAMANLRLLGIEEKFAMRSGHLSGGQQQRVAIARALSQKPQLLLADEPVASLDPATCHAIMQYLKKVNREFGLTIMCNLHFLSLVREYATRVIALRSGEIVYEGAASTIDSNWFKKIYGEEARDIHVD